MVAPRTGATFATDPYADSLIPEGSVALEYTGNRAFISFGLHDLSVSAVTCKIYVGESRPFSITQRIAESIDPAVRLFINAPPDTGHTPGDTAVWQGTLVASTRISVTVSMPDSIGVVRPLPIVSDSVTVTNRVFAPYAINTLPQVVRGIHPQRMAAYPPHFVRGAAGPVTATYGTFLYHELGMFRQFTDPTSYARLVAGGPNDGLAHFASAPPLNDHTQSWIHPSLYGGLGVSMATVWYHDQDGRRFRWIENGIDLGQIAACDTSGVARLRSEAEQHEGIALGGDSHFQRLVNAVASSNLAGVFERTVTQGTADDLRGMVSYPVATFWDALAASEQEFEQPEYNRIFGRRTVGVLPTDSGTIRCFVLIRRSPFPPP